MRRFLPMLSLLLSLLLLSSCAKPPEVSLMRERISSLALPAGVWYQSDAEAWEEGYLSESVREIFFGELTGEYVLYLGTEDDAPCEILYAALPTEYDALLLASRLSAREQDLKARFASLYGESLCDAFVMRRGRYVFYVVSERAKEAQALF